MVPLPTIWGFHPYSDVSRVPFQTDDSGYDDQRHGAWDFNTNVVPAGDVIWYDEVGGRIDPANTVRPTTSLSDQAREIRFILGTSTINLLQSGETTPPGMTRPEPSRVAREYIYQLCGPQRPANPDRPVFDAGLLGTSPDDSPSCQNQAPRPAYNVLLAWTQDPAHGDELGE